ncbi:uncharacterized protein LOC135206002 [Macrobrachium nipponense]|uniref:uncharacterized protein LOC135206002 n=1 Tax=Macrobrachium nipponense TaxID=159736 RepID=UPI0030C7AE5F
MATYISFSKITGVLMLMMIAQIVSSAHAQIGKIPSLQADAMEAKHLGLVVGQLLAENLVECYVVAILSGKESSFQRSLREVLHDSASKGVVYLDGKHLSDNDQRPFAAKALDTLKPRFTCRAIVLDVLASALTEDIFRFLEDVKLYLHPDTYIVLAGSRDKLTELILQNTFRNTVNILYLGIGEEVIFDSQNIRQENNKSKVVEVFTRCFYCDGGEAKVYSLGIWNPRASPHIEAQLFKGEEESDHRINV